MLLKIKNYPRKLSRLSKIVPLELSGALQRDFFYSKIINILQKQPSTTVNRICGLIIRLEKAEGSRQGDREGGGTSMP